MWIREIRVKKSAFIRAHPRLKISAPSPSPAANPVCRCRAAETAPRGKRIRPLVSTSSADRTRRIFRDKLRAPPSVNLCSTTRCSPFFSSGTPVTTNVCSVAPASSCNFSSSLMCGTISPPILLKRFRRSVICRKPSSSSAATSPVQYQPSGSRRTRGKYPPFFPARPR